MRKLLLAATAVRWCSARRRLRHSPTTARRPAPILTAITAKTIMTVITAAMAATSVMTKTAPERPRPGLRQRPATGFLP